MQKRERKRRSGEGARRDGKAEPVPQQREIGKGSGAGMGSRGPGRSSDVTSPCPRGVFPTGRSIKVPPAAGSGAVRELRGRRSVR